MRFKQFLYEGVLQEITVVLPCGFCIELCLTHKRVELWRQSLDVTSMLTVTSPGLCDFEMTQVICHVLVLRKLGKF